LPAEGLPPGLLVICPAMRGDKPNQAVDPSHGVAEFLTERTGEPK
jgi:hypothetical protein